LHWYEAHFSGGDTCHATLLAHVVISLVYKGSYKGLPVAIKSFNVKGLGFTWENFMKEISLLAAVQHPNICHFYGANTIAEEQDPFIVMQLFRNGSLKDITNKEAVRIPSVAFPFEFSPSYLIDESSFKTRSMLSELTLSLKGASITTIARLLTLHSSSI
jgi:serine/threonine protein kinase